MNLFWVFMDTMQLRLKLSAPLLLFPAVSHCISEISIRDAFHSVIALHFRLDFPIMQWGAVKSNSKSAGSNILQLD